MNLPSSTERLAQTLEQVCKHWEGRRQDEKKALHFSVALSREEGTPAAQVARIVGQRLHWPVYDRELLEKIARDMGIRPSLLESVDEKPISWLLDSLEAIMAVPQVNEFTFVRNLVKTLMVLGSQGECIIVGRGAGHFLPPATTLRVRLVAPLKDRIALLGRQLGLGNKEAADHIETFDRQRTDFVQHHFQIDPRDPSNYDLVLNTSQFSPEECALTIISTLHYRQAHLCAAAPVAETLAV